MTRQITSSAIRSVLSALALLSATLAAPASANTISGALDSPRSYDSSGPQELRAHRYDPAPPLSWRERAKAWLTMSDGGIETSSVFPRLANAGGNVATLRVILTVVTRVMSDGRVITQESVPHSMEECLRIAQMINAADGGGKYQFFASCREN